MDFEVLEYCNAHNIHPVSFSSLSEGGTDLPTLSPAVAKVVAAHNSAATAPAQGSKGNVTTAQVMYAYVSARNITVLSTYDPQHPDWAGEDVDIFDIELAANELAALDNVTAGKRTCPDCYTFECQACAQELVHLGCPVGELHGGFVWGRSNPKGMECMACAALGKNRAPVRAACGGTSGGETLETMVPKACGI